MVEAKDKTTSTQIEGPIHKLVLLNVKPPWVLLLLYVRKQENFHKIDAEVFKASAGDFSGLGRGEGGRNPSRIGDRNGSPLLEKEETESAEKYARETGKPFRQCAKKHLKGSYERE
jgi:hypothetical protein